MSASTSQTSEFLATHYKSEVASVLVLTRLLGNPRVLRSTVRGGGGGRILAFLGFSELQGLGAI